MMKYIFVPSNSGSSQGMQRPDLEALNCFYEASARLLKYKGI